MKIEIVIPAHNKATTIAEYLASVQSAIKQLHLTIKAYPLVVLDSCIDLAVGDFSPLSCHEDVDLVRKFKAEDFSMIWNNRVGVTISSRYTNTCKRRICSIPNQFRTKQSTLRYDISAGTDLSLSVDILQ